MKIQKMAATSGYLDGLMKVLAKKEEDWPASEDLKEGTFDAWCKRNGFGDGASASCADKALDSDSESVRGKAMFYLNTVKPEGHEGVLKKHREKTEKEEKKD